MLSVLVNTAKSTIVYKAAHHSWVPTCSKQKSRVLQRMGKQTEKIKEIDKNFNFVCTSLQIRMLLWTQFKMELFYSISFLVNICGEQSLFCRQKTGDGDDGGGDGGDSGCGSGGGGVCVSVGGWLCTIMCI